MVKFKPASMELDKITFGIKAGGIPMPRYVKAEKSALLGDIYPLFENSFASSAGELDKNIEYFYTRDKEGKIAVGKLTESVSDTLKDNEIIFASYYRHKGGIWKKSLYINAVKESKDKSKNICSFCGGNLFSTVKVALVESFSDSDPYCDKCINNIKDLKIFNCATCGRERVGIRRQEKHKSFNFLKDYIAVCDAECLSIEHRFKECNCCGLPLMQSKKCGRCQRVRYCSKECQVKDWPVHKTNCA
jgi:hypothetical protein